MHMRSSDIAPHEHQCFISSGIILSSLSLSPANACSLGNAVVSSDDDTICVHQGHGETTQFVSEHKTYVVDGDFRVADGVH
jgi:hypothetical protein